MSKEINPQECIFLVRDEKCNHNEEEKECVYFNGGVCGNFTKFRSYTDNQEDLYAKELEYINKRRHENKLPKIEDNGESWGICFSGGGIRSATLCLGIMKGFMKENMFRLFDYLCTVSGGGYIGSCLTSLLSKEPGKQRHSGFDHTVTGVCPEQSPFEGLNEFDEKGDPVSYKNAEETKLGVRNQMHHLRTHGEYLIPNRKILKRDLQRFVGSIFAGVLYHMFMFIMLLIALTALLHFILFSITTFPEEPVEKDNFAQIPLLRQLNYSSANYYKITDNLIEAIDKEGTYNEIVIPLRYLSGEVFYKGENDFVKELTELYPKINEKELDLIVKYAVARDDTAAGYVKNQLKTWLYSRIGVPLNEMVKEGIIKHWVVFSGLFVVGLLFNILAFKRGNHCIKKKIMGHNEDTIEKIESGFNIEDHYQARFIKCYNCISIVMIPLMIIAYGVIYSFLEQSTDNHLWVLFLPLTLSMGMTYVALRKRIKKKDFFNLKESSIRSLYDCLSGASFYCIILSIAIPIGIVFLFSLNYFDFSFWWALISLALSYFIFQSSDQGGWTKKVLFKYKKIIYLMLILLFISLAFSKISHWLIENVYMGDSIFTHINGLPKVIAPLLIFLGLSVIIFFAGFIVNSNNLSPHYFYRDRLTEAYLKTDARIKRKEAGAKTEQGMPLINLRNHERLNLSEMGEGNGRGPYHILVAALNLQGSDELTRKQMLSEHFIFSKYYVGSKVTGFVKSDVYRGGKTRLARAMTISAAAAGSAIGQYSYGAQSFAATLFNVRLGYWMANPWFYREGSSFFLKRIVFKIPFVVKLLDRITVRGDMRGTVDRINPGDNSGKDNYNRYNEPLRPFWPKWLFLEMIGKCTARRRMVNLSDGGHTGDNLGLMPLLERRCKVIVVCDAEEDHDYDFDSFNNAVRMIYLETKTRIEINLDPIMPKKNKDGSYKLSKKSVVIGDIIYPPEKEGDQKTRGKLVYIKSSLSEPKKAEDKGKEKSLPVHVKNYHEGHRYFPHQKTTDQFFDDAQFEAYRALGEYLGEQAIQKMAKDDDIKNYLKCRILY